MRMFGSIMLVFSHLYTFEKFDIIRGLSIFLPKLKC